MDSLLDIIQGEVEPEIDLLDAEYQGNMFTVEEAMRETGALKPTVSYTRSPYDAALMKLIDSVPMR